MSINVRALVTQKLGWLEELDWKKNLMLGFICSLVSSTALMYYYGLSPAAYFLLLLWLCILATGYFLFIEVQRVKKRQTPHAPPPKTL